MSGSERYLQLGLRLGRHVDGLVDAYYGPAELKSQVDKSNKDTLSLDVVRKADEIEKLARSVKEKMKGS